MTESCTVCLSQSTLSMTHPEAKLFRCPACSHLFSQGIGAAEPYENDYFDDVHSRWFENPNIALFENITSTIPNEARSVLDVGCGRGDFLKYLKGKRPDLRLVGIDVSDLEPTQEFEFWRGDISEYHSTEKFDFIVSLAVIEHISYPRQFVGHLKKLLNPNGSLVLMTVKEDSLVYAIAKLGKVFFVPLAFNRLYGIHHLNHFTTNSLKKLLELEGVTVRKIILHDSPIDAVDIPVKNKLIDSVFRKCLSLLSSLAKLTSATYLQTFVCKMAK